MRTRTLELFTVYGLKSRSGTKIDMLFVKTHTITGPIVQLFCYIQVTIFIFLNPPPPGKLISTHVILSITARFPLESRNLHRLTPMVSHWWWVSENKRPFINFIKSKPTILVFVEIRDFVLL